MNVFVEIIPYEETRKEKSVAAYQKTLKSQQMSKQPKKAVQLQLNHKRARREWTYIEMRRYIRFLVENRQLFELSPKERRRLNLHSLMSRAVESRDKKQCGSHHQKMKAKYKTLQAIINSNRYLLNKIEVQHKKEKLPDSDLPKQVSKNEETKITLKPYQQLTFNFFDLDSFHQNNIAVNEDNWDHDLFYIQ